MIVDLKAFCINYIPTPFVMLFSANSKSIQNWKQKLIIWNDISSPEISKLLNCFLRTFIILWLVCTVQTQFFLLTWVCCCITFQYFGWKIFTSCSNLWGHPWRCAYFGAKLAFIAGIFLKKYPWYHGTITRTGTTCKKIYV